MVSQILMFVSNKHYMASTYVCCLEMLLESYVFSSAGTFAKTSSWKGMKAVKRLMLNWPLECWFRLSLPCLRAIPSLLPASSAKITGCCNCQRLLPLSTRSSPCC